ncbi:Methionine--tRNA ligase, partial [Operophtera brumata]
MDEEVRNLLLAWNLEEYAEVFKLTTYTTGRRQIFAERCWKVLREGCSVLRAYVALGTEERIPWKLELVNDLELPEVTLTPYIWTDPEDTLSTSDSISVVTLDVTEEVQEKSLNTASSVALSRAMTDSDIDYDRYKRTTSDYIDDVLKESRLHRYEYNEKLRQRMKKYFDEECNVFTADDPGLIRLEEALLDLDYKVIHETSNKSMVLQYDSL